MHAAPPPAPDQAPTPFEWPVRVYYEDTDAAGMVYYANYLRFCERARTEYLRAAGFEQQALREARGIVFVVRSLRADYLTPALLDDTLLTHTSIVRLGRASLSFGQRILCNGTLLFEAAVDIACIDTSRRKATAIPADVRQQLLSSSSS